MGSETFDVAFSDDHPPPHVHGQNGSVQVVIEVFADGRTREAERWNSVRLANAKLGDVRRTLRVAEEHGSELWGSGSRCMADTVAEMDEDDFYYSAEERKRMAEFPEPMIVEALYYPDPDLVLFVLKISDGRRLVIPREYLQPLAGATPVQAAEFTTAPLGSHLWWPQLDDGVHLSGLLEHRYGNVAAVRSLELHKLWEDANG